MIKAIIFDFGGVILKHKATLLKDILHELFPNPGKVDGIWKKYKLRLYAGKATSEELLSALMKAIPTDYSANELKDKWMDIYKKETSDVDWQLLDFIGKLRRKYKVYLMTDTIDMHDKFNSRRQIYNRFDEVYKSFEEGLAKAEGKDAYLNILKKIKVRAQECVFVDDLDINVKTSEEVGMKGIAYRNFEQLKEQLDLQV